MKDATPARAFVDKLSARDFEGLAETLAPDAVARLLLPRGADEAVGRAAIARRFEGWFGSATGFEVLTASDEPVGSRRLLHWRFDLSRDGSTAETIEQVAFADVGPAGIHRLDLLCSGFLADA